MTTVWGAMLCIYLYFKENSFYCAVSWEPQRIFTGSPSGESLLGPAVNNHAIRKLMMMIGLINRSVSHPWIDGQPVLVSALTALVLDAVSVYEDVLTDLATWYSAVQCKKKTSKSLFRHLWVTSQSPCPVLLTQSLGPPNCHWVCKWHCQSSFPKLKVQVCFPLIYQGKTQSTSSMPGGAIGKPLPDQLQRRKKARPLLRSLVTELMLHTDVSPTVSSV